MTTNYWNFKETSQDFEELDYFLKEIGEALKKESDGLIDYSIEYETVSEYGYYCLVSFHVTGDIKHSFNKPTYRLFKIGFKLTGFVYRAIYTTDSIKYDNISDMIEAIKKDIKSEKIGKTLSFLAKNSENEAEKF